MNTMKMPEFTAEEALQKPRGRYRSSRSPVSNQNAVIPSIPACGNCDGILERCESNGWRPRAVCNACAAGNCYDEPPMPDPYPNPWDSGPPHWIFDKYWDL